MTHEETPTLDPQDGEESLDPQDWAELRALAHRAVDDAVDHMASLRVRPAWQHAPAHVKAHFAGPAPAGPQPVDEIYAEWLEYVRPRSNACR